LRLVPAQGSQDTHQCPVQNVVVDLTEEQSSSPQLGSKGSPLGTAWWQKFRVKAAEKKAARLQTTAKKMARPQRVVEWGKELVPAPAPPPEHLLPWKRTAGNSKSQQADAPVRQVFLVGIAGPSGVGKSTLAEQLAQKLLSPMRPVCLDTFMRLTRMPKYPSGETNWETPGGIDFVALTRALHDLEEVLTTKHVLPQEYRLGTTKFDLMRQPPGGDQTPGDVFVVVEGFLLFHEDSVCSMLDAHIWLEADCSTCSLRRYKRSKRQRQKFSAEGFEKFYRSSIWPQFELFRAAQLTNAPEALRLDAAQAQSELAEQAAFHCRKTLQEKKGAGK
jgi:uridine kinase